MCIRDSSQNERNRIMQNFRDGKLNVLVATDVAARGIEDVYKRQKEAIAHACSLL